MKTSARVYNRTVSKGRGSVAICFSIGRSRGERPLLEVKRTSDAFARIPAYMRLVGLRSIEALTMSAHDLSNEYVFSFHIPVECAIDPRSVVTASNVILQLAAIP